jgi:hypothetical protein
LLSRAPIPVLVPNLLLDPLVPNPLGAGARPSARCRMKLFRALRQAQPGPGSPEPNGGCRRMVLPPRAVPGSASAR